MAAPVTLNLAKATTPLSFEELNGAWTATYDQNATTIDSQIFSFVHNGSTSYGMWWGFTASNSTDRTRHDDIITYQYSNMAMGGIAVDEDGAIRTDSFGDPISDPAMPYLVGYYASFLGDVPCSVVFTDGLSHAVESVYVNLTSYPYYCVEEGDAYARAFRNGDKLTLTIDGIHADGSIATAECTLASAANGVLSITRGWRKVDLSALGAVSELRFRMSTTDRGEWGDNTPLYFALDKLTADSQAQGAGVQSIVAAGALSYDRTTATIHSNAAFTAVFNSTGQLVASTDKETLNIESLPAGIYVVRAGTNCIKIAR